MQNRGAVAFCTRPFNVDCFNFMVMVNRSVSMNDEIVHGLALAKPTEDFIEKVSI